jgi:cyclophilin family peptidyl-prolyl cis-trans isomerase
MPSFRFIPAALLALSLAFPSLATAAERLTITLKTGDVVIELADDVAPQHAARLKALADAGEYDNVAFHRVIEGFMAQTGDVQFGDMEDGFAPRRAGMGGSSQPDLAGRIFRQALRARHGGHGAVAKSQFRQFAVLHHVRRWRAFSTASTRSSGTVVEGMEHVDQIKRGNPNNNGAVTDPDRMIKVRSGG